MDITSSAPQTDFDQSAPAKRKTFNFASKDSPLAAALNSISAAWLINHACERWSTLHQSMHDWREKMAKWERQSEEDYSDRRLRQDPVNMSSVRDIFTDQNDSLGTVAGFYDFHLAQAKDDIFGTSPWLAANPEGSDDIELADIMTKHSQWKINDSNVESVLKDALRVSTWGGTAFVKVGYHKELDTFKKRINVAYSVETGQPFLNEMTGDFIQTAEELVEMGVSEEQMEWRVQDVEETIPIYSNVDGALIDYKDIAFNTTAASLNLLHTDVFCRFRMGILDVMEKYGIPPERRNELMGAIHGDGDGDEVRDHRGETNDSRDGLPAEEQANPPVTLVEGFMRCDPTGSGKVSRIHMIFSPDMHILFAVDFLGNITPGSILPVFPVRINKIPGRIFGKGYFEKYENFNDAIDRQYNGITYRNRTQSHVWCSIKTENLEDDSDEDQVLDPKVPLKLKPDKTLAETVEYVAAPSTESISNMLLQQMVQMIQMRSGITSAAQGEMKGVPSANTATGTRDLQSRGATLVKAPIEEQSTDLEVIAGFSVILIYANLDHDGTFKWGEGREAKLYTIAASDVAGIKANVSLTLVQAQNQQKLQSAQIAIQIYQAYVALMEIDKVSARSLFVQALSSLGYHNADDIVREAIIDPATLVAVSPPELQPFVQQAFEQAGMLAPQNPEGEPTAPVSQAA